MNGVSPAGSSLPSSSSERWRMLAGGGAHDSRRSSVIDRIMLRFRPIAPKPATCPNGASDSNNDNSKTLSSVFSSEGVTRKKRKYVRVRRRNSAGNHSSTQRRNDSVSGEVEEEKRETPTLWASSDLSRPMEIDLAGKIVDRTVVVVEVTVEYVTATCTSEGNRDRRTVPGWVMSLEMDTCPGFVSDGSNSVTWLNGAFRKLVRKKEDNGNEEVVVGLVIKKKIPSIYWVFTGHVKLQYYYCHHASGARENNNVYSRVLPFDLWRIDGGGFAWRLDIDSALTLGRT